MQLRTNFIKTGRPFFLLFWAIGLIFTSMLLKIAFADTEEGTIPSPQSENIGPNSDIADDVIVCKHADYFEQDEKQGLTILIGKVQIERPDGFLNADKVTIYKDVETDEVVKTVAEGHVELRDGDIFATCDHAVLNHIDDIVELQDNVVVLQEEDRLEANYFTFNRRTGKRTGKGDIRFRVRLSPKEETTPSKPNE